MSILAGVLLLLGGVVAALAGVGLVRFGSPYARLHAAGKASPVAFLLVAAGAAVETDAAGRGMLAVACVAVVLTVPIGVHLLARACSRADPGAAGRRVEVWELSKSEAQGTTGTSDDPEAFPS